VRLKRVLPYIEDDTFLLTYGDGLIDSDINESIRFHEQSGKLATLTAVHPTGRFGDIDVCGGTVTHFNEKPDKEARPINGGFFIVNKGIDAYLSGDPCVFEKDALPQLAQEGKLTAFDHPGFWQCMDTYREQLLLEELWQSGNPPWKIW